MPGNIKNVIAVINYIESHLHEKPNLDTIAEAQSLQGRWERGKL